MNYIYTLILLSLCTLTTAAQQNTDFKAKEITSPKITPDKKAEFNIYAPNATEVKVAGDWMGAYREEPMTKESTGIWRYTTPTLKSELYTYRYFVDGVEMLDPANPFVRRGVGNNFSIFFISGGNANNYMVQDVPHGNVIETWYHSNILNSDRRLQIYTPPAYNSNKSNRFPVLYLLHGSGGDKNAWVELGCVPRIIDNLIAQKKIEPMIVVMPNGNPSKQATPGETPENLNYKPRMSNELQGYNSGAYEKSFPEIVAFTDKNFNTIPTKENRAIAGLSMGGFHALFIAANHPQMFNYVALFSPGVPHEMMSNNPVYNNVDQKLKNLNPEQFQIYIGNEDFLYNDVKTFRKHLDSLGFKYKYFESANGHVWSNWRQYLMQFAPILFKSAGSTK